MPMICDLQWATIFSALLTPTVAGFGLFIAYRQWAVARNKLKHDLFERRFKVYEAARNLLAAIMTSGKAKDEDVWKFKSATREAKWLLNEEVAEYLHNHLYRKAIDLQRVADELEGIGISDVRTTLVRERAEIKNWFIAQDDVLDEHFSPFLKLTH